MKQYLTFIIRYRFFVLAAIFAITVIFGAIATQGIIASSIENMFFGKNHAGFQRYQQRIREFANDEVFIVIYHDPDLLSEASIQRLQTVVDKIENIDDVGRVDSLLTAQHTFAQDDTLYVHKYVEEALDEPERRAELLETLKADPLLRGIFVSEDGQHGAVIIELKPDETRPVERGAGLVSEVNALFEHSGFDRKDLHLVGMMASIAEITAQARFNMQRLFPVVCVVLLAVVYLIFHRLWPVVITFIVTFIAVIWMFGFAVLLDKHITVYISGLPAILLIVATSDVIHLCNAYLLELAHGRHKMHAILQSCCEVGAACFWTSATTFVGFVSLAFIPMQTMRQAGLALGFGVAVALLLAVTLTPILFAMLKPPKSATYDEAFAQKTLGRMLFKVEQLVLRAPKSILLGFLLLFGISIYGVTRLGIEVNLSEKLEEENWVRRDLAYYNDRFAGANFLEIFIDTPVAEGVFDPDTFNRVDAFQREVEQLPEVDNVVSLIDLIQTIDGEMNPQRSADEAAPFTRELLSQYLLLFEMAGGEDLDRFVDFDRKTLRLAARLKADGGMFTFQTGQKVQQIAEQALGGTLKVETSGLLYLLGSFLDQIFLGQKRGLLFAFLTILVMMCIIFRSIKIGLWSMVPNILPLLVLGGYLGYFWRLADSDTIIIAMIAIGIGVDDTIHFLTRLRFESARATETAEILRRAFHFSGRAMVGTTIILVVGFFPFALSGYILTQIFGTLLPLTLIVALLADILMVPALVKLGVIRFAAPSHHENG